MIHEIFPTPFDNAYRADVEAKETDRLIAVCDGAILLNKAEEICIPTIAKLRDAGLLPENPEFRYLFSLDNESYFMLWNGTISANEKLQYVPARKVMNQQPEKYVFAAELGYEIFAWYQQHRFCGKCGAPMQHDKAERKMVCPACGAFQYPQICPSVIVAVFSKGRLLVTRYNPNHQMMDNGKVVRAPRTQSLIAGYMEVGESPEETVIREVREEAGLNVKNIRYYAATPWPISGSLLLGYTCEVDGDETIHRDAGELAEAAWLVPEEIEERDNLMGLNSVMLEAFRKGQLQ